MVPSTQPPFASFTGAGVPVPVLEREGRARSRVSLALSHQRTQGWFLSFRPVFSQVLC